MTFDTLTITDSTTREELLSYVNDLEDEVDKLEKEVKEQQNEIEDISLTTDQRDRLEQAAELMAAQGLIHNTPHARQQWIDGK